MKDFKTEHLAIIGEFVISGVILCLSEVLKDDNAVDEFVNIVKQNCLDQEINSDDVSSVLDELSIPIKEIKNGPMK